MQLSARARRAADRPAADREGAVCSWEVSQEEEAAERRMCTGVGARPLVVDGKEVPWHQCRLRDCKMERKVGR